MPQKLAYKNVSSPLRQVAAERQQARQESHQDNEREPLSMVQRVGMVLYWAGAGTAAILAAVGAFALFKAPDLSFTFFALCAAAFCWLVGRAFKYILVGR